MTQDEFGGFDLDDVRRKVEADRRMAEAEARRNAEKKPNVVPAAEPVVLDVVFGPISDKRLNQPDAVSFAGQFVSRFGILQSAGEAVYARKKFGGNVFWDDQRTRTGAFYVVENGEVFVAFDDIADTVKNVVTRYAVEGYDDNTVGKEFLIHGSLLESVLARAKGAKRFLELPENDVIVASVAGSHCYYEKNPYFVAVLGKEMACVNAELIRSEKCATGELCLLSAETVRQNAVDGKAIVRPVGLGGGGVISVVYANDDFISIGRARGVRPVQKGGAQ